MSQPINSTEISRSDSGLDSPTGGFYLGFSGLWQSKSLQCYISRLVHQELVSRCRAWSDKTRREVLFSSLCKPGFYHTGAYPRIPATIYFVLYGLIAFTEEGCLTGHCDTRKPGQPVFHGRAEGEG